MLHQHPSFALGARIVLFIEWLVQTGLGKLGYINQKKKKGYNVCIFFHSYDELCNKVINCTIAFTAGVYNSKLYKKIKKNITQN